jgi:hypothetical protein
MQTPRARHANPWSARALAGCTLAAASLAPPAAAQVTTTVARGPAADAFVCGAPLRASQNFGAAGALAIAPAGAPKGQCHTIMRFDLAGVPAALDAQFGPGAWTIESTRLELWAVSPLNSIFNTPAAGDWAVDWIAGDAWVEGTGIPNAPTTNGITFNSLPSLLSASDRPLGVFEFSGGNGAFSATLANDIDFLNDVAAGGLVSLLARSQGAAAVFNSSDFPAAPSQRPSLVLVVSGPCRPDLTAGAIPGQPGYGQPNGTLNNDDFFYYLAQFAAGNAAIADLTTGAIPGQPGYGIPNGVVNNDDFFFYLAAFAAGC